MNSSVPDSRSRMANRNGLLKSSCGGRDVTPMPTVDHCMAEATIEAADPFVQNVECSELFDGVLQLRFQRRDDMPAPETAQAETTG